MEYINKIILVAGFKFLGSVAAGYLFMWGMGITPIPHSPQLFFGIGLGVGFCKTEVTFR